MWQGSREAEAFGTRESEKEITDNYEAVTQEHKAVDRDICTAICVVHR